MTDEMKQLAALFKKFLDNSGATGEKRRLEFETFMMLGAIAYHSLTNAEPPATLTVLVMSGRSLIEESKRDTATGK